MNFDAFRIAMRNQLRRGPYAAPHVTAPPDKEWLIVERSGAEGQVLQISDAVPNVETADGHAPDDLAPQHTLVALLAERPEGNRRFARFMFVRHLPPAFEAAGIFFPADGFAEISQDGHDMNLFAVGRHFHSRGELDGTLVLHDVPNPAPGAQGGINWHFDAEQRPWSAQI